MTRVTLYLFAAALLVSVMNNSSVRAATNEAPDFKEVCDLLRTNLPGVTDADFNQAAVDGLLARYRGKVAVTSGGAQSGPGTNAPLISKSMVLESDVAYVHVGRVEDGLANEVADAYRQLTASNSVKGVVLDLRFAVGDDYAAAAATADLFLAKARRLLDWGTGIVESKEKTNAISIPVAVLANRETSGAPEALAAVLRDAGAGLVLGGTTAGNAVITREFPLSDGRRLRVAVARVRLGDGSLVPAKGVSPDIEVTVGTEDERVYVADPYATLVKTNWLAASGTPLVGEPDETNRPARRSRLTEAELVRERREGTNLEEDLTSGMGVGPAKPVIRDPALARAVDLLKGLAVVRQSRS